MSLKQIKQAEKAVLQQQQAILDLETLVKSIERCEKTIVELKEELEAVNQKHQNRSTTQDDINYLTDLLACAHKKLNWEKQLTSLQKRTPSLLERITSVMNDLQNPPTNEMRISMVRVLENVQAAMERLEKVKTT